MGEKFVEGKLVLMRPVVGCWWGVGEGVCQGEMHKKLASLVASRSTSSRRTRAREPSLSRSRCASPSLQPPPSLLLLLLLLLRCHHRRHDRRVREKRRNVRCERRCRSLQDDALDLGVGIVHGHAAL